MSAKQVVSPLQSCIMTMLVFICRLSLVSAYYSYFNTSRVGRVVFYSAFCLFPPPQNVANEGSEEESFYAFVRWLIGEFSSAEHTSCQHVGLKLVKFVKHLFYKMS